MYTNSSRRFAFSHEVPLYYCLYVFFSKSHAEFGNRPNQPEKENKLLLAVITGEEHCSCVSCAFRTWLRGDGSVSFVPEYICPLGPPLTSVSSCRRPVLSLQKTLETFGPMNAAIACRRYSTLRLPTLGSPLFPGCTARRRGVSMPATMGTLTGKMTFVSSSLNSHGEPVSNVDDVDVSRIQHICCQPVES